MSIVVQMFSKLRNAQSCGVWLLLVWGLIQAVINQTACAAKAEAIKYLGKDYVVYSVDLETDQLALTWKDKKGKILANFTRLRDYFAAQSQEVVFAVNAGIYSTTYEPLGLHIENSKQLRPLNQGNTDGKQFNFYLKPNGVFYVVSNQASIVETSAFARLNKVQPALACQSGPMLLRDGAIHPAFRAGSTNLHWRSGVGVTKDGKVVFAMSKQTLCFYDFARVFKDQLKCDNALYLDGDICAMYLPELGYSEDPKAYFSGMFAVTRKR